VSANGFVGYDLTEYFGLKSRLKKHDLIVSHKTQEDIIVMPGIHDQNGAPKCPKIKELDILLPNILPCI